MTEVLVSAFHPSLFKSLSFSRSMSCSFLWFPLFFDHSYPGQLWPTRSTSLQSLAQALIKYTRTSYLVDYSKFGNMVKVATPCCSSHKLDEDPPS